MRALTPATLPIALLAAGAARAGEVTVPVDVGVGFTVRIPPAKRGWVMVTEGYVGPAGANVYITTQVLAGLLLADAPGLCDVTVPPDAEELFVPMWAGELAAASALGVFVSDADDLGNGFRGRICERPGPSSNCVARLP